MFEYNDNSYIPIRPLPSTVRINVTGMGWNLFRRSAGLKVPPLIIPLERPSEVKKIVSNPAMFANQLEDFQLNFVLTDTLHLAIEPKGTRWITLALDSPSILFREDFGKVSEVSIIPDSVFIDGPWTLVKSISEPVYLKLTQRNIDKDFDDEVEVKFLNDELIKRDPPIVSVKFKVDRFITLSDSITLSFINSPKSSSPVIENQRVFCSIRLPQNAAAQLSIDSLQAVADLKPVTRGLTKVLPQVKGLPRFATVAHIDSIGIKF